MAISAFLFSAILEASGDLPAFQTTGGFLEAPEMEHGARSKRLLQYEHRVPRACSVGQWWNPRRKTCLCDQNNRRPPCPTTTTTTTTTTATTTTTTTDYADCCKKCSSGQTFVCVDGRTYTNLCLAECALGRKNPDYEPGRCIDCNSANAYSIRDMRQILCNTGDMCLWKGGQCVPQQVIGPKNTNFCPYGSIFIMDEKSCEKAAKALGYIWEGSVEHPGFPTKCYVDNVKSMNGEQVKIVSFNVDTTNTPGSEAQPLCTETDEGFRTEEPDPTTLDGMLDCSMSDDNAKCRCETLERSTICEKWTLCDFDAGRCNPNCDQKIDNQQCKCGTDFQGDVVCKSHEKCDNVPDRSDAGGHIASCRDDTDGSTGRVWEDI